MSPSLICVEPSFNLNTSNFFYENIKEISDARWISRDLYISSGRGLETDMTRESVLLKTDRKMY